MTSSQEQLTELTRRTQESFRHLWQQWSEKSTELMKGMTGRTHAGPPAGANPEEVLDAVFDFAEHLIAQQRIFAKQMLAAAAAGQQAAAQATGVPPATPSAPATPSTPPTAEGAGPTGPGNRSTPGAG
ncbi:hypothetical protein [Pseudonocardia xinjiangensis]|uniref:Uncharacterized protein n=1 Tax=Pseudonocardia xinjiangensis TaxID=75289 RepID=A0ABX1RNQ4_9PSEU|nr:hypothetical protein [Pseudonocardia xinjiangensis]NMH81607.1 hypothetical protein [Pseudonocardia xinjiangensis]